MRRETGEHQRHIDGLGLVAILFILFMGVNVLRDVGKANAAPSKSTGGGQLTSSTTAEQIGDENYFTAPYAEYVVTQGLHGFDYGHAAIDLSAGKGAAILSPINGVIAALFLDDLLNTVLVVDNARYQVTLMHGNYTVKVGDQVKAGQVVGEESNQGNTVDALGYSCRGRDCGYHTHLNVYDKLAGMNVNPIDLFGK